MRKWLLLALVLAGICGPLPARALDWAACQTALGDGAIRACSQIIASRPNRANLVGAYLRRGSAYNAKGDYSRAISDFDTAIQLAPSADAFGYRGLAYLSKGANDAAIVDFDRALQLVPSANAYGYRGLAYLNKGDNDSAIADFNRAIQMVPSANAFGNRGIAYSNKGNYDNAIADLNSAIQMVPSGNAFISRGFAYFKKGDNDSAIADFDKAVELLPGSFLALADRGLAYRHKGDNDRAIADFDRAIAIKPDFGEALLARGDAYRNKGDNPKALLDYQAASRLLSPGSPSAGDAAAKIVALQTAPPAAPAQASVPAAAPSPIPAPVPVPAATQAAVAAAPAIPAVPDGRRRVALVIGNSAYRAVGLLANPSKDADLVGAALRTAGVDDVTIAHDLDREGMVAALRTFAKKADAADWAVIYYAGHGIEVDGKNYLIPVDAQLASDRDVPDETVSLDRMLSAIDGAHELKVVILDACRNNPFARQMQLAEGRRSIDRGLSRVEPAKATMVVYAAKEGTTAADGDSGDSPFAISFAKRIVEPGLEINKVFRFVTKDVLTQTGNQQEPFVYGSLPPEDFIFVPAK